MTEDKNQIATSYDWWSHAGSVSPMPPKIMLGSGREPAMTIHPDGRITLGENVQPTEAAAACIEVMGDMIQSMIDRAAADELAELKAAKWKERHVDTMNDMASLRMERDDLHVENERLRRLLSVQPRIF